MTIAPRSVMTQATTADVSTRAGSMLFALLLACVGCTPSSIVGQLSHDEDEREHLIMRARAMGESDETINKVIPPLTPQEAEVGSQQDSSCRSSYVWKNALTWTGSLLIAAAAGLTIGAAYATGNNNNNNTTNQIAFGVSAGTAATLGSGLVAIGGIVANGFSDRGCVSKMSTK